MTYFESNRRVSRLRWADDERLDMAKFRFIRSVLFVALTTLTIPAFALPAAAGTLRAWVSGHGLDNAACGAISYPCRTLQFAHDKIIRAGGAIYILDSAEYGSLTIRKSLTVANDGVGVSVLQSGANDPATVTIAASAKDEINLRGLSLDGGGVVHNGVYVSNAGILTMRDCIIHGFTDAAVSINATAFVSFTLSNVTLSKNGKGVFANPGGWGTMTGVIDRSSIDNNRDFGVFVQGGASATAKVSVTILDSSLSQNGFGVGVATSGAKTSLLARDVVASNNRASGFLVNGAGTFLRLAHSVATGNAFGVTIGSGGHAESFGDNYLLGNSIAVSGGALKKLATQ